jgi:hypothetical protein
MNNVMEKIERLLEDERTPLSDLCYPQDRNVEMCLKENIAKRTLLISAPPRDRFGIENATVIRVQGNGNYLTYDVRLTKNTVYLNPHYLHMLLSRQCPPGTFATFEHGCRWYTDPGMLFEGPLLRKHVAQALESPEAKRKICSMFANLGLSPEILRDILLSTPVLFRIPYPTRRFAVTYYDTHFGISNVLGLVVSLENMELVEKILFDIAPVLSWRTFTQPYTDRNAVRMSRNSTTASKDGDLDRLGHLYSMSDDPRFSVLEVAAMKCGVQFNRDLLTMVFEMWERSGKERTRRGAVDDWSPLNVSAVTRNLPC